LNIPPPYNWKKAEHSVQQVVQRIKPIIIHSTLFKSDIISRRVASAFNISLVNSLVNNSYHPSRFAGAGIIMMIKLKLLQWTDARTARKVDLFIPNSETIRRSNSSALGIPLNKIAVIYRGRTISDYNISSLERERKRSELGLNREDFVILNVSRLIQRKGQLELIRGFKLLLADCPNAVLLIAGDGHYANELAKEVESLGLNGKVKLLGNRNDVPYLMKAADCFAFPSHYEGLPGVLIEGMLSKLPIAASRISENLECVNDDCAYLFETGSVKGIASTLKRICDNRNESIDKAEIAYWLACEKFDIVNIATQYEDAYGDLVKKSAI
jgi:glycosyltransferase involved in cell wall biosynthesis